MQRRKAEEIKELSMNKSEGSNEWLAGFKWADRKENGRRRVEEEERMKWSKISKSI